MVGVGPQPRRTSSSRCERGIIDSIAPDAVAAARDADLVLARRAGRRSSRSFFATLARHSGPKAVVTDGGSTKRDVVAAARAALGAQDRASSCPAHPIAGAEKSGAGAASADAVSRIDGWC